MLWRILFQIISLCAWAYTVLVVVRPMHFGRKGTFFLSALFAAAFAKFAVFAVVGGHSFNPELPQLAIWCYGWAYGSAMLLAAFATVALAVEGAMLLLRRPVSVRARRIRTATLAVAAALTAAWGMYEGVRVPAVNRMEIAFESLPPAFDGYRIVHLSDIHCSTAMRRERVGKIVERVNGLEADLIAITGDFVDGRVEDRREDLAPLASLRARDGVLACTGNHEAYWDWEGWQKELLGFGFVFPEMSGPVLVTRGADTLVVGGMVDPAFSEVSPQVFVCDAGDCFAGASKDAFRVLLCHRPLTVQTLADDSAANIRLMLSGHTHGGAMPVLSILVSLTNEGHVRGLYEFAKGRYLHVSPGTGQWAGFPLRLFNPTEITEIILRRHPAP